MQTIVLELDGVLQSHISRMQKGPLREQRALQTSVNDRLAAKELLLDFDGYSTALGQIGSLLAVTLGG